MSERRRTVAPALWPLAYDAPPDLRSEALDQLAAMESVVRAARRIYAVEDARICAGKLATREHLALHRALARLDRATQGGRP